MKSNIKKETEVNFTHEGARAANINAEQQLRRSVMNCLLFEKEFYEDGVEIANRIKSLVAQVSPSKVAAIAIQARDEMHLRHVPLYLVACLAGVTSGTNLVSNTLAHVIQRADELSEFLAIYAKVNGVKPSEIKPKLSNQVRKGLAQAFTKFSAYSLGKYNRDAEIKLRDALFLSHAKPKDAEQALTWKKLIDGTLETPDTWEVSLSSGADKKETFERLIKEGKLGYFALIRNLRNMSEAHCDFSLVHEAILARKNGADKLLPFRFIAAAQHAPEFALALSTAMQESVAELPTFTGKTTVLIDVSGSMDGKLSAKSDMTRLLAAAGLGVLIKSDFKRVFTFSQELVEVAAYDGLAGVREISESQRHGGTALFQAVSQLNSSIEYDRLIIITDEQATINPYPGFPWQTTHNNRLPDPHPNSKGYMINVASAKHGVGYNKWIHLDGFSESVIRWIYETENFV